MSRSNEENNYTIEDVYRLPEGKRAELIDGRLYYMAAPTVRHQRISMFLSAKINYYVSSRKGHCEVFAAPFAVFLNADDKTYVEPDISVICDREKLLNEKGCMGAPDWVVEIVSPSSVKHDYRKKQILYRTAGVREYWVVDPDDAVITVYQFDTGDIFEYTFIDKVKVGIYEDFIIDFGEITG